MLCLLSILCVTLLAVFTQGAPTLLLPDPDPGSHGYKVAVSHIPLTDTSRKDPYDPSQDRSLMASIFLPVRRDTSTSDCRNTYMPSQTARIADQQFLLNAPSSGVFNRISFTVPCGSSTPINAGSLPIVVLEPHTDTSRLMYTNLARYIAGNGIVVISLDHPGETSIVEFLSSSPSTTNPPPSSSLPTRYNSGTVPLSNFSPLTAWNTTVAKALDTRIADIAFTLSQLTSLDTLRFTFPTFTFSSPLNTSSYGIVGHGVGGSAATLISLTTENARFSVSLSGTPPLLAEPAKLHNPVWFLGREEYTRDDDLYWKDSWKYLRGAATELDLGGSGVMDAVDLPIIREMARGEGGVLGLEARGLGGQTAWPNHAVKCVVEGVVVKEVFGNGERLSECVRNGEMRVVPYLGGGFD